MFSTKKIPHLIAFVLLNVLCFNTLQAQEGRLPSKEELLTKERLRAIYSNGRGIPQNNHLLVTGAEQDCDNALEVCTQSYTQTASYTGNGTSQELSSTCLSSNETNSVWYVFTVQNSGTFGFTLNTANDYDFALYNITGIGCSGVPSATPVRCNYSATYGPTGLTLPPSATIPLSIGAGGIPTMPGLNVTAGQTYVLIVDNYSANTNGYTLSFIGTAQIFDNTPPQVSSSSYVCNASSININYSEYVDCLLAGNKANYSITGPSGAVTINTASGYLCSTGASNTQSVTLNFNTAGMTTGVYTVNVAGGTVADKCGNIMPAQTATFSYLAPITLSATSTLVCTGSPATLSINGAGSATGLTYAWTPIASAQNSLVINPTSNNTYFATATYNGCNRSASISVNIQSAPVVAVNPSNVSLCSGTTNLTAGATIGGVACASCNYTWTGASSQVDNNTASSTVTGAGAGSYSVTVSSSAGCLGNTATSNVSILSPASPPSCDIIYVTNAGSALSNGSTPTAPTTIQNALTLAACNAITIKMAVGDYTINAPLNVNSYVTIEGGFNTTFTQKTSGKATAGGFPTQGTRIIRSTTAPEGAVGDQRLTAINVTASSTNFRFQDLTIEVQNSAAGSRVSNYAIYLGSGCSSYDIVRCVINAGTGSPAINGANGVNGVNGGNGQSGAAGRAGGTSAVAGQVGGKGGLGNANNSVIYLDVNGNSVFDAGDIRINNADYYGSNGFGPGITQTSNPNITPGGVDYNWEDFLGFCDNPGSSFTSANGANGANGAPGVAGVNGSAGAISSFGSGFFTIGGNGTDGTDGSDGMGAAGGGGGGFDTWDLNDNGGNGGGGGGAGSKGTKGTGGTAAGGAFGIFSVLKGASANVTQCLISATTSAGGTASTGGNASTGGTGGAKQNGCDSGNGGKGGDGGAGGKGGNGGSGAAGQSCLVCDLNGAVLSTIAQTNFSLTTQPTIIVDNKSCSNVVLTHSSTATSWPIFGSGSNPTSAATATAPTTYTTLGRKTVATNLSSYTDFNNILVSPPSTGSVLASVTSICPSNTVAVSSSAAGTAGLTYTWSVAPAGATISTNTLSAATMTFANATASAIIYTVTLNIASQCCGTLTPVVKTITVNPTPVAPTASVNSICKGGDAIFSATAPSGVVFDWYDTAAGTTLLTTGTTYTMANATATTVYVNATNAGGCASTLTPVVLTPTTVPAPTAIDALSCDPGNVSVGINPASGVTDYSWYSNAAGTILVQSGPSLNYSQNIPALGGSYIVYAQSTIIGCTPSALVPVTASVSSTPVTGTISYAPSSTVCAGTSVTISIVPGGGNGTYSYNWSPITSTVTSITYTANASSSNGVDVTSGGCTKTFNAPLIVNVAPSVSILSVSNSTICSGLSSVITPTGATTYTLLNNNSSGTSFTVNPTSTTTYSIIGSDATACPSNTVNTTVTVTALPTITVSITNSVICDGGSTTLTASGTATNYSWSGGVINGAVFSPTVTDAYTVIASGTGGCTNTAVANVTVNSVPTITTAVSNPTICNGSNTTLTASGTASSYTWTNGVTNGVAFNPTITNTYVVTGTLANCTNTAAVTVTVNAIPNSTATVTGFVTCATTTVNLNSTNIAGASYTWSAPAGSSVNAPGSNVNNTIGDGAGTYTLDVLSAQGCSFSTTASVSTNTTQPTVSAGSSQTLICGAASVTLTGVATPTDAIINWLGGVCGSATSLTTTACAPGIYTLVATHPISSCSLASMVTVSSSTDVPQATVNPITNSITCTNTVVAIGVTLSNSDPVTYAWSGTGISGPTNTANTTASLAGSYAVVITNTLTSCASTLNVVVSSNTTVITPTIVVSNSITCTNTLVTLSSTPLMSSGVTYTWSGAGIVTFPNAESIDVNASGNFVAQLTNTINGCVGSATATVNSNTTAPTVTVTPSTFTISCTTNTVQLSASATPTNVTYAWTPSGGTLDFTNIPNPISTGAGSYDVLVTATNGCTAIATATITPDANAPVVSVAPSNLTITCVTSTVTSVISSTNTTLTYTWFPAPLVGGNNPSFIAAGVYDATITASNGCSTYTSVTVTDISITPTITINPASVLNCTLTSTQLSAVATPTDVNNTFNWSGPGTITNGTTLNPTVDAGGNFVIALTNTLSGCNTSTMITVTQNTTSPTAIINVASTNSVISCAANSGTVTLSTTATVGTFTWLPSGSLTNPLNITAASNITLLVLDPVNSCKVVSAPFNIIGNTTAPQNPSAGTNVIMTCGTSTAQLLASTTTTDVVSYSWSGPGIVSGGLTSTPIVNMSVDYTVTITNTTNSCTATSTVNVSQQGTPTASITMNPNPAEGLAPFPVSFTCSGVGVTATSTFTWTYGDGSTSTIGAIASNIYTTSGTYTVVVQTTGACGTATATAIVIVNDGLMVEIPNVFTPNGDGTNDLFTIKSTGVKEISLNIFNRWGQQLYSFSGPKAAWDGKTHSNTDVPTGTYFYFVVATGFDGQEIKKQGTVNLFR